MRLNTTIELACSEEKIWYVIDQHYGDVLHGPMTREDADKASASRPYSKVVLHPERERKRTYETEGVRP